MDRKNIRIIAGSTIAGLATLGVIAVGSSAFAGTPSAAPSAQTTVAIPDVPGQATGQQSQDQQGQSQGQMRGQDQGQQAGAPGDHGPMGGPGGMGGQDTAVTGDEAQKVIDAVKAKDGSTITEVRKDPDGTYDALGTKADGTRVFYDVSADLTSVTEAQGGPGGMGGGGRHGGGMGPQGQAPDQQGQAPAAQPSAEPTK